MKRVLTREKAFQPSVAEQADEAIISMVRDYAQNVDVIFGDDGLLSAYPKNKTIIVMSTLDPETMNHLGKKVEANTKMRKKPHGLLPCGFYAAFPPLANFRTIFNLQILSVNEHQNTN